MPEDIQGRRAALAKWIANPKNPLTARVMVNRVWQYHFGSGSPRTPTTSARWAAKASHTRTYWIV